MAAPTSMTAYCYSLLPSFIFLTCFGVANPDMIWGGVIKRWVGYRAGDIKMRLCVTSANENRSHARKGTTECCV